MSNSDKIQSAITNIKGLLATCPDDSADVPTRELVKCLENALVEALLTSWHIRARKSE